MRAQCRRAAPVLLCQLGENRGSLRRRQHALTAPNIGSQHTRNAGPRPTNTTTLCVSCCPSMFHTPCVSFATSTGSSEVSSRANTLCRAQEPRAGQHQFYIAGRTRHTAERGITICAALLQNSGQIPTSCRLQSTQHMTQTGKNNQTAPIANRPLSQNRCYGRHQAFETMVRPALK